MDLEHPFSFQAVVLPRGHLHQDDVGSFKRFLELSHLAVPCRFFTIIAVCSMWSITLYLRKLEHLLAWALFEDLEWSREAGTMLMLQALFEYLEWSHNAEIFDVVEESQSSAT